MKKLLYFIALVLIFSSCGDDLELRKSNLPDLKNNIGDVTTLNCEGYLNYPEPKFFSRVAPFAPLQLPYGSLITFNWQSNDLFNPSAPLGDYLVTVEIKNNSGNRVMYYKNGLYVSSILPNASKIVTWSGDCNECLGDCPESASGGFNFTIIEGPREPMCEAYIQVKLFVAPNNTPVLADAQVWNYVFQRSPVCPS